MPKGGSILGTSRTNPFKTQDGPLLVLEHAKKAGIDSLIAIGGDDTITVAYEMFKLGLNCVAVPKTIDNDLAETDYTFGFNTAVSIATEAIDRLHTTAETHHRVMIIEVMGRYTGWIALDAGTAGGADIILIPEKPFKIEEIIKHINKRKERGKNFSLIVVAEGAKMQGENEVVCSDYVDEFGHAHLGGIGFFLAKEIEKLLSAETRVVVLGHLQRGGSPTAFDRILCTRFGKAAIELVNRHQYGCMVALKGKDIVSVPLKEVIGKRKMVDPQIYESSSTCFG